MSFQTVDLSGLNDAQREAVLHSPRGSLQILASPGTGKTKTLTSRVAQFVLAHQIPAKNIIVVTFANKAANEMKVRLRKMIGDSQVDQLRIGTFHSVCVRYLRRHGAMIDLPNNFVISDQSDSLSIIKTILKEPSIKQAFEADHLEPVKPNVVQDRISKAKSKGWTPDIFEHNMIQKHDQAGVIISDIYRQYQAELKRVNALDFDDLLIQGHRLFKRNPSTYANIQAVLVDEWQDTNTTQYEIAKELASKCRALTVVGDPDQSIYGWRSADVENIERMRADFHPVTQLVLEENYRSTGAILAASSALIDQDTQRLQKTLRTSEAAGQRVVLRQAASAAGEAAYVAGEIKRQIAYSGNTLTYADFAILLRYNALSRSIEQALQQGGIPNRVLGGSKFFDRVEIKDVLSYLQLVENPGYGPAFERAINVPKRSIGDQTLASIKADAIKRNCTQMEIVTRAIKGQSVGGLKPMQKQKLKSFVTALGTLKKRADGGAAVPDLIDAVIDLIEYEGHLTRTYGPEDTVSRMQNLEELKTFAVQVAKDNAALLTLDDASQQDDEAPTSQELPSSQRSQREEPASESGFEDALEALESSQGAAEEEKEQNPLRIFLAASMLSTDQNGEGDTVDKNNRVTISTIHSAKGCEWPCVFVCAVEDGVLPFYKCTEPHELDEERRLLFVAMTRAQTSLHLTHAKMRMRGTFNDEPKLSRFLVPIGLPKLGHFVGQPDEIDDEKRAVMWKVLRRTAALPEDIATAVAEYSKTLPAQQAYQAAGGISVRSGSQASAYRGYSSAPSASNPYSGGYQSGSQSYPSASQGYQAWSQKYQAERQGFQPASQGFTTAKQAMAASQPPNKMALAAAETRMSRQQDGALLNPAAPTAFQQAPTLSSFQTASNDSIALLKTLGKAEDAPTASISAEAAPKRKAPVASGSKSKKVKR